MLRYAIAVVVMLGACEGGKKADGTKADSTKGDGTKGDGTKIDTFHGVQYRAPIGTNVANSGVDRPSHYPDPQTGQVVEIPTVIRPAITLTMKDRFYVEIAKESNPITLEGMKATIGAQSWAKDLVGATTPNGWTLTYTQVVEGGPSIKVYERGFAFADATYKAQYSDQSKDLAAAAAIVESIRPAK